jgi:hypothetical protein
MHREEINKRRKMAQTDAVWKAWTPQMWEKTVGHEIADELPLSDHERWVRALAAAKMNETGNLAESLEQLYGPDAVVEHVDIETGEITPAPEGASQQAGTDAPATPLASVPAPGDDEEPEPGPPAPQVDEVAKAKAAGVASTVVPTGAWAGQTLQQVHDTGEDGAKWFQYVLRHPSKYDDAFVAAVDVWVKGTTQAEAA